MPAGRGGTAKGERRRAAIVRAALDLVRRGGPTALSHRAVADAAGVPLAATTYYFRDLDELATAAGTALVDDWVVHAAAARSGLPARTADLGLDRVASIVVDALLPPGDDRQVRAHHAQLLQVADLPSLAVAIGAARSRLDEVVAELIDALLPAALRPDPAVVLAVVDGAVLASTSEGRAIRPLARSLVSALLAGKDPDRDGAR